MHIPQTLSDFKSNWTAQSSTLLESFIAGKTHFVPNLLPEDALSIPPRGLIYILEQKYGEVAIRQALNPNHTVDSPVQLYADSSWLKRSNMVGINVRTIGSFWNIVKYLLTQPKTVDAVHILPMWEPGVVASLYGIASWNINTEFFCSELAQALPHLNTVEKQLKVVVNLIHTTGRAVGFDVVPHTDRYSEIALANPSYFEWLQRKDFEILDHSAHLHQKVQQLMVGWLNQVGPKAPEPYPHDAEVFFSEAFPEEKRIRVLFGDTSSLHERNRRRNIFIQKLYEHGYEPVPATMAPPYRGLAVSRDEAAKTIDADGRVWRDYVITRPEGMSRVFGPLGRYKLYECKDDNANWEIDFDRPRLHVFEYVQKVYDHIQRHYNFDFMRGDMSHVQMRPTGVPTQPDEYYDILKAIKGYIRQSKPYFGYFAESFLAPPNTMAYGDENDHLEASDADSTLGDLQSMVVGSGVFLKNFGYYLHLLETRKFAPNFTVMTADKDDPRFDEFYLRANEARLFMAYFLTHMPSYTALGFEMRDPHPAPAPNEHYTKLYVFQLREGKNATAGPYVWGKNAALFHHITRLKVFADGLMPKISDKPIRWYIKPSETDTLIIWRLGDYKFMVNLSPEPADMAIGGLGSVLFSTVSTPNPDVLAGGEGRVYFNCLE